MKITEVEAMVLDTGADYAAPADGAESHGVRFVCLLRISDRRGHRRLVGGRDAAARRQGRSSTRPRARRSASSRCARRSLGEDPLQRERLWQKMYR